MSFSGSGVFKNFLGKGGVNWSMYVTKYMYLVLSLCGKDEPFIK